MYDIRSNLKMGCGDALGSIWKGRIVMSPKDHHINIMAQIRIFCVLMMYSSLRHETRTRDLLNVIIRTATFFVCALMKCLCVATLWIKNDPTKDQTNTALGAAQSPFCSEDSKPRRQCEGERGQAVRREVSFWEMRFALRSDITFGCPCLWACSCHQALQLGDIRPDDRLSRTQRWKAD